MLKIREKLIEYQDKISECTALIKELQSICTHEGANIKFESDTGNYCKSDDSYWINWHCPCCSKGWITDQDKNAYNEIIRLKANKT